MTVIRADYGAMERGHGDLLATWQRIEAHLAELDAAVAATGDMQASTLTQYQTLKGKWTSSATERQAVLRQLTQLLDEARQRYIDTDAALAAQFTG